MVCLDNLSFYEYIQSLCNAIHMVYLDDPRFDEYF